MAAELGHRRRSTTNRCELELSLNEYLNYYAALPLKTSKGFLQHLSRYDLFAQKINHSRMLGNHDDSSRPSLMGAKILDVGCGEGFGSYLLAELGAHVVGIDFHEDIIGHCRKKYGQEKLEFFIGEACHLAFPNDCFDGVCAMDLIEHLEDPNRFILEAKRVLKRNKGILALSTPNHMKHLIETGALYPFHKREYLYSEFLEFANQHFSRYDLFAQCPNQISEICDILRDRDFIKAPVLNILKYKLTSFVKKAMPSNIRLRLREAWPTPNVRVIYTYNDLKINPLYKSITFVNDRFETCSDFILMSRQEEIKQV